MNHRYQFNFEMLCRLPYRMHVYWTDTQHKLLGANEQQLTLMEKISDLKDPVHSFIYDLYPFDPNRARMLCDENEEVLSHGSLRNYKSYLRIPKLIAIDFITTKMPFYNSSGKIAGVLGLSYYAREIALDKAEHYHLTQRELDCLSYLIQGKTAAQIATCLKISARTVEFYLDNAKHKLNCQNKKELIAAVNQLGLIKNYK